MVRNRQIISSSNTLVDEFPYASTAQRYILQVQVSYHVRFEVLAPVLKIHVVKDMTRCRMVHGNRCSGVACCLHSQSSPRTIDCHEYEGRKQAVAEKSVIICKSTERHFLTKSYLLTPSTSLCMSRLS